MTTIDTLREGLAARRGDWRGICATTGLSYWWLTKFAQGRIKEPGLSKIETLQGFIAANPIAAAEPATPSSAGKPTQLATTTPEAAHAA